MRMTTFEEGMAALTRLRAEFEAGLHREGGMVNPAQFAADFDHALTLVRRGAILEFATGYAVALEEYGIAPSEGR